MFLYSLISVVQSWMRCKLLHAVMRWHTGWWYITSTLRLTLAPHLALYFPTWFTSPSLDLSWRSHHAVLTSWDWNDLIFNKLSFRFLQSSSWAAVEHFERREDYTWKNHLKKQYVIYNYIQNQWFNWKSLLLICLIQLYSKIWYRISVMIITEY